MMGRNKKTDPDLGSVSPDIVGSVVRRFKRYDFLTSFPSLNDTLHPEQSPSVTIAHTSGIS